MESADRGGSRRALASSDPGYAEILGGRRGGVGNDTSDVGFGKSGEVREDVFDGVTLCQAGQDSAKGHASADDDGFTTTDFWVACYMSFEVHPVMFCAARSPPCIVFGPLLRQKCEQTPLQALTITAPK